MSIDVIPGFEETAEDVMWEPKPGCCDDCDEILDIAAWKKEVTQ